MLLIRMQIRNFKRFDDITIEVGDSVVFIEPNISGKPQLSKHLFSFQLAFPNVLKSVDPK